MYNLIVGFTSDTAQADRMLEFTDPAIREYLSPGARLDPSRLWNLPALVMPELGDANSRQVARIGRIEHISRSGRDYRFRFVPNPVLPEFASERVASAAAALGIADWEFQRTHWAVKDVDVYRVAYESLATPPMPKVFKLPLEAPTADLVAVMMPFGAAYSPVYSALQDAVADAGLQCQRADDIWVNDAIMEDIASLIWRSQVVISDLTGKNPNVFYETGIAHTLGRDVIQITQSADDVPFDLRHLRYLTYLPNGEGLRELKTQVTARLRDLCARS